MITISAYNLLSIIACGEVTLHTLYLGVLARGHSKKAADEILLNGLLELCNNRLLHWEYHRAYGDEPAVVVAQNSGVSLLAVWQECFEFEGPRTKEPHPSTILFELTAKGAQELNRKCYRTYEVFLDNWYS